MYLTFDRKTKKLVSFSDQLGFERNLDNKTYVYMNDYFVIMKNDYFESDLVRINPETNLPEIILHYEDLDINEVEVIKLREELAKKARELIAEKKEEVSENRDIGYLTEKFRIAKGILKKTADEDDTNDFEEEVQLRSEGETKEDLAKKVKRKYKKMYRRITKLDAYYTKFLKRIERRNDIDNINNAFERFKEELEDNVR